MDWNQYNKPNMKGSFKRIWQLLQTYYLFTNSYVIFFLHYENYSKINLNIYGKTNSNLQE